MRVNNSTAGNVSDGMPLIQIVNKSKKDKTHHEIISLIVSLLKHAVKEINYDHITTTIPKNPFIPLEYKKGKKRIKGDISFLWEGHLIIIEIKTIKLEREENGESDFTDIND